MRKKDPKKDKKCNCGPDCTCGCQEGGSCTCEDNYDCKNDCCCDCCCDCDCDCCSYSVEVGDEVPGFEMETWSPKKDDFDSVSLEKQIKDKREPYWSSSRLPLRPSAQLS